MSKYIITITPDPPEAGTETTVRVDLSSGRPLVQELLVRSGNVRGLDSGDVPDIDFGMLVRAVAGGASVRPAETGPAAPVEAAAPTAVPPRRQRSKGRPGAAEGDAAAETTIVKSRNRPERITRKAPPPRRPAAVSTAEGDASDRAYRRMPDADEVIAAYEKVGTITGLAEHFGVPRHTAQGWAGRLRRGGYHIGRS